MMPLRFTTLSIALMLCLGGGALDLRADTPWRAYAEDLEIAQLKLSSRLLFSSELTLFRTSLKRYRVGVVSASEFGSKRSDVRTLAKAARAVAGINANFFDEQGNPLGLVVSRGNMTQKLHRGGSTLSGIFFATRKKIAIVNRSTFVADQVLEAVQAGPRLLSNGAPVSGLRESLTPSKRAGVCIDNANRLILFVVSSGLLGLDIEELQDVLLRNDINCIHALNFDGGGSAQLYVTEGLPGATQTTPFYVPGQDTVPVMLALFIR